MGRTTSIYLMDDAYEGWKASGLPMSELVRRGLAALDSPPPDPVEVLIAKKVRAALREAGLLAEPA